MVVLYFAWSLYVFLSPLKSMLRQHGGSTFKVSRAAIHLVVIVGMVTLFVRWSLLNIPTVQGWGSLPESAREIQVNRSGYKAFVPTADTQCWDSELPCTVMLDDGLQRRPLSELARWFALQPRRFSLSIER
jgi:hypothetical protein